MNIVGLYRDNGKEHGNYYNGESNEKEHGNEMETGIILGCIRVILSFFHVFFSWTHYRLRGCIHR